ncbi:MAG: TolC family protein [Flavobacteriaceae bacterium]|nr:TolC family protein [Flavobacteriaceae bacterium]
MEKNKYCILALVQLFFIFSSFAQEFEEPITEADLKKWTLEECIYHALENNITVKLSELDIDLADISMKDAYGNYLPSFNMNMNNQWVSGLTQNVTTGILEQQVTRNFSFNGTSGVPIFQGLANLRQFQRAKIEKLASKYNLNQIKDNISLNVANSYLQILVSKQTLELLKEQNEVTKEQIDLTQELVNSGIVPEGDLLEIKAQDADEEQQITVAENDVQVSLIGLAQLLLIKDYEEFDIADEDYDIPITDIIERDPKEILQRAKEERYEVLLAEQDVELAEKDLQLARSQYYPTISGFFNYNTRETDRERIRQTNMLDPDQPFVESGLIVANTGESVLSPNLLLETVSADPFFDQLRNNDGYTYGIQMNIPVFNGFSVRNQVQRSKVNVMRAEYQLEQTELELESNVYQAYLDARGAARTYEASLKSVEAQKLAYEYAESRFEVGMSNSVDLTQSKFRLVNAENNLIQAKYNYIFRIKVLELFFGIRPVEY